MTDYRLEPAVRQVSWTAIWGGVLTFLAIWAVFETLATAIFVNNGPGNAHVNLIGLGIWSVILSIIAMFAAGRITG